MENAIRMTLGAAAIAAAGLVHASEVSVNLSCPATVSYGSGNTVLQVGATVSNSDYDDVTLRRYASGMMVNGDQQTLIGMQLFGPIPKLITPVTLSGGGFSGANEITMTLSTMKVPNAVGRMAYVHVEFITLKGKSLGGGGCAVNIVQ